MIRKFDYRNRKATIQGFSGKTWEVHLGLTHIKVNNKDHLIDMGTLIMDRKVNPSMFREDAVAARTYISNWEDFEEKPALIQLLDDYIIKKDTDQAIVLDSALREIYGIQDGMLLSREIASGKLKAHASVITNFRVVNLIEFLMNSMRYLAMNTFPAPKSPVAAARAAKRLNHDVKALNEHMKGMDSFQIFTAFRIASFLEKAADRRAGYGQRWRKFSPRLGDVCGVALSRL